jgi:hypothetical protein
MESRMNIISSILVVPFSISRKILLPIVSWTAINLILVSIIPYALLWINNIIILILSAGNINNLRFDGLMYEYNMAIGQNK